MPVEATSQGLVLKFLGLIFKRATGKCGAKLAANVVSTSNFWPKGI